MLQRRHLDDAAGAVAQAVLDAEVLQDLDVLGGIVEALLVAEHLQCAAAALLVGAAGVAPQLFPAGPPVGGYTPPARPVYAVRPHIALLQGWVEPATQASCVSGAD